MPKALYNILIRNNQNAVIAATDTSTSRARVITDGLKAATKALNEGENWVTINLQQVGERE